MRYTSCINFCLLRWAVAVGIAVCRIHGEGDGDEDECVSSCVPVWPISQQSDSVVLSGCRVQQPCSNQC